MKTTTLLFAMICIFALKSKSQNTIAYGYDNSGNRTSRSITLLKSTANKDSQNESKQEFKDQLGNKDIMIYPNPVKSELTVTIPGLEEGEFASLVIYSQDGRLLYINEHATTTNILNLSEYAIGMYYLNIQIGAEKVQWKIIKE